MGNMRHVQLWCPIPFQLGAVAIWIIWYRYSSRFLQYAMIVTENSNMIVVCAHNTMQYALKCGWILMRMYESELGADGKRNAYMYQGISSFTHLRHWKQLQRKSYILCDIPWKLGFVRNITFFVRKRECWVTWVTYTCLTFENVDIILLVPFIDNTPLICIL